MMTIKTMIAITNKISGSTYPLGCGISTKLVPFARFWNRKKHMLYYYELFSKLTTEKRCGYWIQHWAKFLAPMKTFIRLSWIISFEKLNMPSNLTFVSSRFHIVRDCSIAIFINNLNHFRKKCKWPKFLQFCGGLRQRVIR